MGRGRGNLSMTRGLHRLCADRGARSHSSRMSWIFAISNAMSQHHTPKPPFVFTLVFATVPGDPVIPWAMGWTLSGAHFRRHGVVLASSKVHADGNNLAWVCECGAPVLLIYLDGRAGSDPRHPRVCPGACGATYSLSPPYRSPPPGPSQVPAAVIDIV